jgi:hypothetical protein
MLRPLTVLRDELQKKLDVIPPPGRMNVFLSICTPLVNRVLPQIIIHYLFSLILHSVNSAHLFLKCYIFYENNIYSKVCNIFPRI